MSEIYTPQTGGRLVVADADGVEQVALGQQFDGDGIPTGDYGCKFVDVEIAGALDNSSGTLRMSVGTGALDAAEGSAGWESTTKRFRIHDGARDRTIGSVGWQPYAYPVGFNPSGVYTTALNLAAVGGSLAIPFNVTTNMSLAGLSFWNTDSATQRSVTAYLYQQPDGTTDAANNALPLIVQFSASSFTPVAASLRTLSANAFLAPGVYWLLLNNFHATSTLGIGSLASSAQMIGSTAQTKTIAAPSDPLDFVAATWTKVGNIYAVRLNGVAFGDAGGAF